MPRTTTQLQILREQRQAAILQAALHVFARYGYGSSSIRQIAREANIAQGLLYTYFPGKEALLVAIMERGMADVAASFLEADQGATPFEQIQRLVHSSFALIKEHRQFWQLSYSVRMQPEVLAQLDLPMQQWTTRILTTLERYLTGLHVANPRIEAALLFAQIDGASQHYVIDPDQYPLEEVAAAIIARYRA